MNEIADSKNFRNFFLVVLILVIVIAYYCVAMEF